MEWVTWVSGCFEQKFRKSWSASCCQPSAIEIATQQLWSEIAQDWARATLAPSSLELLSRGRCPPPTAAGWRASRPPWSPSCSPPPPPPWSPGLVQCSSQACHSQASPLCTQHTHSWTCKTWRIVKPTRSSGSIDSLVLNLVPLLLGNVVPGQAVAVSHLLASCDVAAGNAHLVWRTISNNFEHGNQEHVVRMLLLKDHHPPAHVDSHDVWVTAVVEERCCGVQSGTKAFAFCHAAPSYRDFYCSLLILFVCHC